MNRKILLALACATALGLSACGSDEEGDPLPRDSASLLEQRLDVVESQIRVGGGACNDLESTFSTIDQDLENLPSSVDPDIRTALEESFASLQSLASEECDADQQTETTETVPPPTIPTETVTVPTVTTPETTPRTTPSGKEKKNKGTGLGTPGGGGAEAPEGD